MSFIDTVIKANYPSNVSELMAIPSARDIPQSWQTWLGPGAPMPPVTSGTGYREMRAKMEPTEPRSYQYNPNVNIIITPRIAYGLTSFSQLDYYAENVSECALSIFLLTERMKALRPIIYNPDDDPIEEDDPHYEDLAWMTSYPDKRTSFDSWLAPFMWNTLVYDAACVYLIRDADSSKITACRVIDGSTILPLIDQRGETPQPPAPAFTQIIWGQPMIWMTGEQIWYHPRLRRSNAPYGISPIERGILPVQLLSNIYNFELSFYVAGTMPEMVMAAPLNWTPDQVRQYEQVFNAQMAGNPAERRRIRFVPNGFTQIGVKTLEWRKEVYMAAARQVYFQFGIPPEELGETTVRMMNYKFITTKLYQMGIQPNKALIESLFNFVIARNGYKGYYFRLDIPSDQLDPDMVEKQWVGRWQSGLVRRDEARMALGQDPLDGKEGNAILTPVGGMPPQEHAGQPEGGRPQAEPQEGVPEQDVEKAEELGELCPNCAHDLAIPREGWYKCANCGQVFYAEESDSWFVDYELHKEGDEGYEGIAGLVKVAVDLDSVWTKAQ